MCVKRSEETAIRLWGPSQGEGARTHQVQNSGPIALRNPHINRKPDPNTSSGDIPRQRNYLQPPMQPHAPRTEPQQNRADRKDAHEDDCCQHAVRRARAVGFRGVEGDAASGGFVEGAAGVVGVRGEGVGVGIEVVGVAPVVAAAGAEVVGGVAGGAPRGGDVALCVGRGGLESC